MSTELTRNELINNARGLYSLGSRNYLLKCYSKSADELSEVCALYEKIYGELSDELGMPYLLYAKSLIALALDENKVIDVPDEEEDEDEDEQEDDDDTKENIADISTNKTEKSTEISQETKPSDCSAEIKQKKTESDESKEPDSTVDKNSETKKIADSTDEKKSVEDVVTSSEIATTSNGKGGEVAQVEPSTSNGIAEGEEDEENEAASNLQLAWEILELAAKIFTRQGLSGLPNLAEVQTELANIEFENNILDSAREDYEKALKIYKHLTDKYRRAMAEIHYKIGLTYLMQQMNQEGAESLKNACALIEDEINEMRAKENLDHKDTELIEDMEETKQEIWEKIAEIEETRQQNIAEVRAALDNYIRPTKEKTTDEAGLSSSSSVASSSIITSSSKPTDITHLIKRKKPDSPPSSEAEAAAPLAKKTSV